MKKLSLVILLLALITACTTNKKEGYTIEGSIRGLPDDLVLLQIRQGGTWITMDSVHASGGNFTLDGKVDLPTFMYLRFRGASGSVPVFVENASISVVGSADSLDQVKITGSKSNDEYTAFNVSREAVYRQYEELSEKYRVADSAGDREQMKALEEEFKLLDVKEKQSMMDFIADHPSSVVAAYVARINASMLEVEDLEKITGLLSPVLDSSRYVTDLKERLVILKKVAVGQPAPDFTMADTSGNPVSLSLLKGKTVLVDFWASWCKPCRTENPNVVACYREFHSLGFEVLGVSLDRNREDWLQAIAEDTLTWTHVSDLKFWDNAAGKLYGINAIPSNILLDPGQIIIAKNLRGDDLRTRLENIFSE
ncbi:MAG: TlpA disulfide reductase family protein [Bacteroidales bacterium]|nr:AhpC/TSA family protein [Lentimicrobiaceae bacterium]MDD5695203.1 TlpA disulfide reductase family protein [Bacteroidales bacterium]